MKLLATLLAAPLAAAAAFSHVPQAPSGPATPASPAPAAGDEAAEARALSLNVFGNCPGPLALLVNGARPGSTIAFLWSFGAGSAVIQNGRCAGTMLGLDAHAQFGGATLADASGAAFWPVTSLPPSACGRALVQALEVARCATSNVVQL